MPEQTRVPLLMPEQTRVPLLMPEQTRVTHRVMAGLRSMAARALRAMAALH